MNHELCEMLRPYIVRIETQGGTGTGFLFAYNEEHSLAAVATALHVVVEAHRWRQPIRIIHEKTGKELFLRANDRIVDPYEKRDAAALVFPTGELPFPDTTLKMIGADKFMPVGHELGWMGFPGVVSPQLCFFRGAVSAFLHDRDCYLIDGVAINGVSGGPVFIGEKSPHLVGIVSAYIPNPVGAKTLPGLAVAQDISPLYETISRFKNMDEAKKHAAAKPLPPGNVSEPAPSAGPSPAPAGEKPS